MSESGDTEAFCFFGGICAFNNERQQKEIRREPLGITSVLGSQMGDGNHFIANRFCLSQKEGGRQELRSHYLTGDKTHTVRVKGQVGGHSNRDGHQLP